MKIIGLTGKAGAGKDTAAAFALDWCEAKGLTAERVDFADPLKKSAAAALGYTGDDPVTFCNGLKEEGAFVEIQNAGVGDDPHIVSRITGRRYLQFYGTEAHRDVFGPDFWVEITEKRLAVMAGNVDVVFLTDPRFANEARMIGKHDGEIWEIVRPDVEAVEAHSSEDGLPEGAIEFQLYNNGALDEFRELVEAALESNVEV